MITVKAYSPENLMLRHMYWYAQYPQGMVGVSANNFFGIVGSAFKVEYTNQNHGYVVQEL